MTRNPKTAPDAGRPSHEEPAVFVSKAKLERQKANRRAARLTAAKAREKAAKKAREKAAKEAARQEAKNAAYPPESRRQMHAREIFARAMGRERRRQQAAIDRSTFFCNRLIENRLPQVNFSDMQPLKNVRLNYGYIDPKDRPTPEEFDDERRKEPK